MNALDRYLESNGIRNGAFAALVGASEATISRLRNGKQTPSYALVRKIAEVTGGAVLPNDFMPVSTGRTGEAA
jgi:transcriptional regulator with XRE-family HTH domain